MLRGPEHERKILNDIKSPPSVPSSSSGLAALSKDSERVFSILLKMNSTYPTRNPSYGTYLLQQRISIDTNSVFP